MSRLKFRDVSSPPFEHASYRAQQKEIYPPGPGHVLNASIVERLKEECLCKKTTKQERWKRNTNMKFLMLKSLQLKHCSL